MSTNNVTYKVLWVDDQEDIVDATQVIADRYNIDLVHFTNWKEAEEELRRNFNSFSAIILDALCKLDKSKKEQELFIHAVLPSLNIIFGEKQCYIPWYILSAQTMSRYGDVVEVASLTRQEFEEEWGAMHYNKNAPKGSKDSREMLFETIKNVAKEQSNNSIRFKHADVFKHIGKGKLVDARAGKTLLKMLSALYYPEDNLKFEFAGNPLRKIVEYLFRAAKNVGLLPDECFEGEEIKLQLASLFFAGNNVSYDRRNKEKIVRWGKPGPYDNGSGGDKIFPQEISDILKYVLNQYVNPDSHTSENEPFLIDEQNKELFFGCVLQVCHVIKWFGAYVENHPSKDENLAMHVRFEGKLNKTSNKKDKAKVEEKTLEAIKPEVPKPAPKPIMAEDIIGKTGTILNGGKGMYVQASAKCKVLAELSKHLTFGNSITIEAVEPNTGSSAEEYPFIITKLSIKE